MRSISALRQMAVLPVALGTLLALGSCDGTPATGVTCDADLGQTDAARKVNMFVETSNALVVAANSIDRDMQEACIGMAEDLGLPNSAYAPLPGTENNAGAKAKAACTAVNAEIQRILKEDVPTTAKLTIVYTPAVCTIDLEAQTKCIEECEPKTVTVTDITCEPGHFYGNCSAMCTGSCTGGCDGQCSASCNGSCSGVCKGNCKGTCATMAADGSCNGMCNGTCNGSCSARCQGTCSGSCGGTCTGGCSGECTAWVQPPQCTQSQRQVTVNDCHTTCESKARFEAVCTNPSVYVTFDVTPHKTSVDKLVVAVTNHYAQVLKVLARTGTTIGDSVSGFATALDGATTYASQLGLQAGACLADAGLAVGKAVTQVNVSATFSVSISASVTASGSAAAQ
jgi:modification target Cys-rich repeat protein